MNIQKENGTKYTTKQKEKGVTFITDQNKKRARNERRAVEQKERRARDKNELAKLHAQNQFLKNHYNYILEEFEKFYSTQISNPSTSPDATLQENFPISDAENTKIPLSMESVKSDNTPLNIDFTLFDELFSEEHPDIGSFFKNTLSLS